MILRALLPLAESPQNSILIFWGKKVENSFLDEKAHFIVFNIKIVSNALCQNDACISPDVRFCFVTDHFHIFNCRVYPIAPVSKRYLNKIYLIKFLLLTGEIVENVYLLIRKHRLKILKFVILQTRCFPLSISYSFWDKGKFTFSGSCDVKIQKINWSVTQKYLNKIYLKKLKFLINTVEIVENVY